MSVTLIYTNWRRKKNLEDIIGKAKKQTISPRIVVIDNASDSDEHQFNDEEIEIIKRHNDKQCWERWLVSFDYDSEYICIMDDDLNFTRDTVLNECELFMKTFPDVDCLGYEGVRLEKGKGYFGSEHYRSNPHKNLQLPIIKGRFMFIRKNKLEGLDRTTDPTCDDIKVSSHLNKKLLPNFLFNAFEELPQGSEALSAKSFQSKQREYTTKRYFKNY
jgi:hypothetical protein